MVIYWDILLGINLIINAVILFLTSVAVGVRVSLGRILLGALGGAVYVVASEFSSFLQTTAVKGVLSLLLVAIVFGRCSWRAFLFRSAVFYLVSFAIGGAVLGWTYFWRETADASLITVSETGGGILIGASIIFFCLRRSMERAGRRDLVVRVQVECEGRRDAFCGLVDSGNLLATSFRRTPVIVAQRSAVKSLVGKADPYFAQRKETQWVRDFPQCEDVLWQSRAVVQPYRTIDGTRRMLIGLRVDTAIVETDDMRYRSQNCIVAVTDQKLSADGSYAAIVPSRLLAEGEIEEGEREWVS